ncbi:MAG: hypothetical protein DMG29_17400 [Acidobacteria bacterium]|nr:MAG: hypothetical protein DMG29_17400 [Acidobacteriota bacterium]
MTEPNKYFRNCNLIVEIAAVGFALATLSYKLDGAAAQGCNLLDKTAWVALDVLRPVILGGWQAVPAYLCEDSSFLQHLLQIVASIWPCFASWLARNSRETCLCGVMVREPLTNTSKKDTVPVDFTARRSTLQ